MQEQIKTCTFLSEIGKIRLYEKNGGVCAVDLVERAVPAMCRKEFRKAKLVEEETETLRKAREQMQEYFAGRRKSFDVPLYVEGTEFQKKVWNALLSIPYGETRTYKQVAEAVGNEKACRAVGMANNRNPLMILIPCHRVIGSDGRLVGYGGGMDIKEYLLRLEKNA